MKTPIETARDFFKHASTVCPETNLAELIAAERIEAEAKGLERAAEECKRINQIAIEEDYYGLHYTFGAMDCSDAIRVLAAKVRKGENA